MNRFTDLKSDEFCLIARNLGYVLCKCKFIKDNQDNFLP